MADPDEVRRRNLADAHRDEVVPGSGRPVEPWQVAALGADPGSPPVSRPGWLTWTPPWEQWKIDALNHLQHHPGVHPYTCGNDSRHPVLVAIRSGWTCLACDYTQPWAYPVPEDRAGARDETEARLTSLPEGTQWTIRPLVGQSYGVWGTTGAKMFDLLRDPPPSDRLQRNMLRTLLEEAIDRLEEYKDA